jgi:hypothetical protein
MTPRRRVCHYLKDERSESLCKFFNPLLMVKSFLLVEQTVGDLKQRQELWHVLKPETTGMKPPERPEQESEMTETKIEHDRNNVVEHDRNDSET